MEKYRRNFTIKSFIKRTICIATIIITINIYCSGIERVKFKQTKKENLLKTILAAGDAGYSFGQVLSGSIGLIKSYKNNEITKPIFKTKGVLRRSVEINCFSYCVSKYKQCVSEHETLLR